LDAGPTDWARSVCAVDTSCEAKAKCHTIGCSSGFGEKLDAGSTACAVRVCVVVTYKDTCWEAKEQCDRSVGPSGFKEALDAGSTACAGSGCAVAADKDARCEAKTQCHPI